MKLHLLILSFVQGVTEFLPVSSSGHLAILGRLFNLKDSIFSLAVYLHLASLLAMITFFYRDIKNLFKDIKTIKKIVLALSITVLIAVVFEKFVRFYFENINYVALSFFITAVFLFWADKKKEKEAALKTNSGFSILSLKGALLVGIAQGLAVLPGISRVGITIAVAIFMGLPREAAFRFSFLLAIPTIFGATIYESRDVLSGFINKESCLLQIVAFIITFITGLISLKILKKIVIIKKLSLFSFYCCIIGVIILLFGGLK